MGQLLAERQQAVRGRRPQRFRLLVLVDAVDLRLVGSSSFTSSAARGVLAADDSLRSGSCRAAMPRIRRLLAVDLLQ